MINNKTAAETGRESRAGAIIQGLHRAVRYLSMEVFLALALTGCGSIPERESRIAVPENSDVQEQVTLRIFDKNARYSFDDEIARAIMDKTGIRIIVEDTPDNPAELVDIMLANRSYPDIILVGLDDIGRYRDSGSLVDISGYIEQLGGNIKSMYGDTMSRIREKDGGIYYLTNWYGEDRDAVSAFQIRYDYLCSLVGKERADSDQPFTQEEFLELLRRFQEAYPEINGLKSIPFTVNLNLQYDNSFRAMYGMKQYYEKDDRLYHLVRHPRYIQMLDFMNTCYREEVMDKSWVVSNEKLFEENMKSGRVFATACAYWDISQINRYLQSNYGEDAIMLGYKVLGMGISEEETTYGGRNSMGWDAIAVTDNCENVEAAVRLADFLASEEGQYLMLWGIEGRDWNMENGRHVPSPKTLEKLKDGTLKEDTPIRRWTWFIKNGYGADQTPYDLAERYLPGRDAAVSNRNMKYDYWDMAPYSNLEPERDSREALQWKNIHDIFERAFPKIVNAPSHEEMVRLYEKMIKDMDAEGMAEVESVITEKYQIRMETWSE